MVLSRSLVLLCAAAAVVLSGAPGDGVRAELAGPQDFGNAVYSPHRELRDEVVKVHVKLHSDEPAAVPHEQPAAKKHSRKHKAVNEVSENGETVRTYDHGSVRIDSKEAVKAKKKKYHKKNHHQKKEKAQKPLSNDETVVEYDHGSAKITGKKASAATGDNKGEAKEATTNEQEVTNTANEVTELVTQLSSTSTDKKSILDTYGPVVIICGIIGGVAAIVGVVGLVVTQVQRQKEDNLDSVLGDDVDVDVEANIAPAGVQEADANDDSKGRLNDPDEDALDDENEEEGTFANGTGHVSV